MSCDDSDGMAKHAFDANSEADEDLDLEMDPNDEGSNDDTPLATAYGTTASKGENLRHNWHGFDLNGLYTTSAGTRILFGLSMICGRGVHCDSSGYKCARSITFGAQYLSDKSIETALKRWIAKGYSHWAS